MNRFQLGFAVGIGFGLLAGVLLVAPVVPALKLMFLIPLGVIGGAVFRVMNYHTRGKR